MTIKLLYKSLFLDVEQLTHRYAEPRIQPGDVKDLAQIEEVSSDETLIKRLLSTATAQLKHALRNHVERVTEDAEDELPILTSTNNGWFFTFLPSVSADGQALADLMHWFCVKAAMWEWAKMFAPNDAAAIKDDMDEAEASLKDAVSGSDMPMKERNECSCENGVHVDIIYTK